MHFVTWHPACNAIFCSTRWYFLVAVWKVFADVLPVGIENKLTRLTLQRKENKLNAISTPKRWNNIWGYFNLMISPILVIHRVDCVYFVSVFVIIRSAFPFLVAVRNKLMVDRLEFQNSTILWAQFMTTNIFVLNRMIPMSFGHYI